VSAIAASPLPIDFLEEDGQKHTYLFSPLSDKDFATADEWIRKRYIQDSMEAMEGRFKSDVAEARYTAAITRTSQGLQLLSQTGVSVIATLDGMSLIAWLGLRGEHPEMTMERARALLSLRGNLKEINTTFKRSTPQLVESAGGAQPQRKKRKVVKKKAPTKQKRAASKKSRRKRTGGKSTGR